MTDAVETMAYANEVPWHGLGFPVTDKMSPKEMLKASHTDWTVSKRPLILGDWKKEGDKHHVVMNGKIVQVKGHQMLVRDTDGAQLSVVGDGWNPVQNAEAVEFFKQFTDAGQMKMETMGSLYGGKYVWALAKIGHNFSLASGDKVEGYLLLASPHIRGRSLIIQFTPIRVVCWNTLMMALGETWGSYKKAQVGQFRMPHSVKFDDTTKELAKRTLGIATEQLDEFKQIAGKLAKKKLSVDDTESYFFEVLQVSAELARDIRKKDADEPKMLTQLKAALTHAPGQNLATAKGTLWGAFNAVTWVADHEQGRTRDIGLKNAWFSQWSNRKRRALKVAVDMVKA